MLFTNAPEATWFVKHWPLAHEKGRQTGHDGYHWVSIFTTITASQRQMKKDVLCSCAMTSWSNGWHEMCRSCCGPKQKLETHPGLDNLVPKLRSLANKNCTVISSYFIRGPSSQLLAAYLGWGFSPRIRLSDINSVLFQGCFMRLTPLLWCFSIAQMLLRTSLRHFVAEPWPHFHQHWGGRVGCGHGNWNILNAMAVGTKVFNATSKSIAVPLASKMLFRCAGGRRRKMSEDHDLDVYLVGR